ncbi:MAG: MMPL family transporter [Dehalococcoidia bacterium]|nr:MMPL family transporter [Dehalococcoidia bacterium]
MMAKILLGIWGVVESRAKWWLLLGVILLVALGLGARYVGVSNQYKDYMPTNTQVYKDIYKLDKNFSNDQLVILIEAKSGNTQAGMNEILSNKNMAAMRAFETHFYEVDANGNYVVDAKNQAIPIKDVQFVITPAFTVDLLRGNADPTAKDDESLVMVAGVETIKNATWLLDANTGDLSRQGKGVFFDKGNARIALGLRGGLTNSEKGDFIEICEDILEKNGGGFDNNVHVSVTGSPFVLYTEETEVPQEISKIMIIAIALMLVITALLFRVRGFFPWRWLSLGLVLIGVVYSMGVFGWMSWDISIVSMAVFPILLGLGVDYSIQFHNRYDEEQRKGLSASQSVKNTLEHIGPPLLIAMLAACGGFAAVLFAKTPMVNLFGRQLIVGVACCLFVAMTLLLPILYLRDRRNDATNKPEVVTGVSRIDKVASWLAHNSVKFIIPLMIIAIGFSAYGWVKESSLKGNVGYKNYISQDNQAMKDLNKITELAGGLSPLDIVLTAPEGKTVLEPDVLNWMAVTSKDWLAATNPQAAPGHYSGTYANVATFFQGAFNMIPPNPAVAENLLGLMPARFSMNYVSPDRTEAHLSFSSISAEVEAKRVFTKDIEAYFVNNPQYPMPEGYTMVITGNGLLNPRLAQDLEDSRGKLMYIGIGFICAMLLLFFRFKVLRVIVAVLPIALILGWSSAAMYAKGLTVTTLGALLPAQLMGIGVEFTILLLMRYYEERDKGGLPMDCMTTAISRIGRAIFVSGLMVMIGFGTLWFAFMFPFLSQFGWITFIDMALVLFSTLVLLPGMVVTFDNWAEKRKKVAVPAKK